MKPLERFCGGFLAWAFFIFVMEVFFTPVVPSFDTADMLQRIYFCSLAGCIVVVFGARRS
jgi:hypothetical protein